MNEPQEAATACSPSAQGSGAPEGDQSGPRRLRVLFLTRYPRDGASSRYCVYQYLPYLRSQGVECSVQSFMSPRLYRLSGKSAGNPEVLARTVLAVLKRLLVLTYARRYDVVFLQRDCLPFGPPLIERTLRRWGIRTVFCYDDALFLFKPHRSNRLVNFFKRPKKYFEIFQTVDCVIGANPYLTNRASEFCPDSRCLLIAEDVDRYRPAGPRTSSADSKITLGWLGSPSTEKYLHLIAEPLRAICERFPRAVLKVVGGTGVLELPGVPIQHVPWSFDREVGELQSFDVGLMPLPDEEWSKGKSGGKARTYMATGIPAVCAKIGFNRELIQHGRTGYLVSTPEEWTRAVTDLIEQPDLRERIGSAAREFVERELSLETQGPKLLQILSEVARDG